MTKTNFLRFFKSIKIRIIFPILFAIIISLLLVELIIVINSFQNENISTLQDSFNSYTILNIFLVSVISLTLFFIILRIKKIKSLMVAKILVFLFIEGGMLSILLFGKLLLSYSKLDNSIFIIFFVGVAYVCTYFAFLTFFDSLSLKGRNRLFVVSSGSLGSFLGLLIPIIPIIVVLILLSFIDLILIQNNFFQKRIGFFEHELFIFEMAFITQEWGIGIADLICYSMIVSSTSANFGLIIGSFSLILILIGSLFTMKMTSKQKYIPGLPVTSILGLLPAIFSIIFL